jgi:Cu/Ag efflux pump CusA
MYSLLSRLLISFLVTPILMSCVIYATADSGAEFAKHIQDLYTDSMVSLLSLVYAYIQVSLIVFIVLVLELLLEVIDLKLLSKRFKNATFANTSLGVPLGQRAD